MYSTSIADKDTLSPLSPYDSSTYRGGGKHEQEEARQSVAHLQFLLAKYRYDKTTRTRLIRYLLYILYILCIVGRVKKRFIEAF